MGMTHVTVTVRNPAEPDRLWDGLFLVDTGAVDCLVPRKHLLAIGLAPKGKRTYELADGSEIKMDITTGDIEFMGDLVGSTIIFGADDAEPMNSMSPFMHAHKVNEPILLIHGGKAIGRSSVPR